MELWGHFEPRLLLAPGGSGRGSPASRRRWRRCPPPSGPPAGTAPRSETARSGPRPAGLANKGVEWQQRFFFFFFLLFFFFCMYVCLSVCMYVCMWGFDLGLGMNRKGIDSPKKGWFIGGLTCREWGYRIQKKERTQNKTLNLKCTTAFHDLCAARSTSSKSTLFHSKTERLTTKRANLPTRQWLVLGLTCRDWEGTRRGVLKKGSLEGSIPFSLLRTSKLTNFSLPVVSRLGEWFPVDPRPNAEFESKPQVQTNAGPYVGWFSVLCNSQGFKSEPIRTNPSPAASLRTGAWDPGAWILKVSHAPSISQIHSTHSGYFFIGACGKKNHFGHPNQGAEAQRKQENVRAVITRLYPGFGLPGYLSVALFLDASQGWIARGNVGSVPVGFQSQGHSGKRTGA